MAFFPSGAWRAVGGGSEDDAAGQSRQCQWSVWLALGKTQGCFLPILFILGVPQPWLMGVWDVWLFPHHPHPHAHLTE